MWCWEGHSAKAWHVKGSLILCFQRLQEGREVQDDSSVISGILWLSWILTIMIIPASRALTGPDVYSLYLLTQAHRCTTHVLSRDLQMHTHIGMY
jgi:hypothetical protein